MARSIRYWFRNVEETLGVLIVAVGALLLLQPILWGNGLQVGGVGFLLAVFQSICMVSLSIQSLQLISINVIFGATRKDSLKSMHLAMITGLLQLELLQVILYFLPFIDKNLQYVAICYTPVLFFFGNGVAYLVSWFQFKSDKAYKVVFTIFCLCIGGIMGFTGAASGDMLDKIGGQTIKEFLDGKVFVISGIVAIVLYIVGSLIHSREIRNMDVRV